MEFNMAKSSTAILGACGEHYVAAILSRKGLIVALPRAGVPSCDLLVTSEHGGLSISMQVKTGTQSTRNDKQEGPIYLWHTSFKAIERRDDHLWYAYVWINGWLDDAHKDENSKEDKEMKQPEVFFVPSKIVASTMAKCKEKNDGEFFWMKVADAEKYKGKNGLNAILDALGQTAESD